MPGYKRSMPTTRRRRRVKRRLTKRGQKGDILPLAALIPALIAGGKALGLSALGGAASFGAIGFNALTKKGSDKSKKNDD